ncbi:MAG: hypothetical protein J3K34DRAFT_514672 [Monoraphidium minutum]|nr:MAG: hypothetical protein J3K34DRAFT_514672 [Monoraphidium minutum]
MSEPRNRRRASTRSSVETAYNKAQQENKRALYHCNYCHRDISNEVRIKCADCQDFDLCLGCFAVGVEVTPHKNTHRYRVVDNLSFPLLHPDWGADEELLLLEGVDVYGAGNWGAVAEHVGTKGRDACREHYFATYIDAPSFPLPTPAPEMAGVDVRRLAEQARAGGGRKRQRLDPAQLQAAAADTPSSRQAKAGGAAAGDAAGGAAAAAAGQQQHKGFAGAGAAPAAAGAQPGALGLSSKGLPAGGPAGAKPGAGGWDITGWHAKRGEFDFEYDQDAEMAISEMEFREDDGPGDIEHKLRMLEIYNTRLDERERRRAFILEHGLLNVRRMQGLETRRLPHEREQHAQMRVFARYLPPGAHEALVEGLLAENRLRARIAELQAYRRAHGLRRAGFRTFGEVDEAEVERPQKSKAAQAAADATAGTAAAAALAAHAASAPPAARAAAHALGGWRTRRGAALDITGLPGTEALAAKERELCAAARLLPAHYLSLKDVMMRDAEANGFISRQDARAYFRMDPSRSLRLYDLLMAAGWLGPIPPSLLAGGAPGAKAYRQALAALGLPGGGGDGDGGGGGSEGGGGGEEEEGEEDEEEGGGGGGEVEVKAEAG